MQPIPLVVGIAVGGVIGFIIALMAQKKKAAELERQLGEAKDEVSRLRREAKEQDKAAKAARAEADKGLAAANKKSAALQKKLEAHTEQAAQLDDSIKELQAAHARAAEEAKAHQAARQQAEGKARQVQDQATEAQRRVEALEQELDKVRKEHEMLDESVQRRTQEVQKLRADLAAAREGSASGLDESVEVFAEASGSLEGILATLLEREGQQAAVLADSNGIVVAAAGTGSLREGMAATAQLVTNLSHQLKGMVPFGVVQSFRLLDGETTIAGRSFECAGDRISLSTYGKRVPGDRILDGAMANLQAALE